jgi:toxin ParE1/3/4
MFDIQIQAEVLDELQEAFLWYETQKQGLGFAFIKAFEDACKKLQFHPQHYGAINEHFRRLRLSTFPFLVVYEIDASSVIIIAVRHAARKRLQ